MADQAETAGTPSPATAAQSVGAQPVGFKGWYAVVMMAVVVMLAQVDRNIISLMVQPMKRDLGLSDTEIGLLTGLAFSVTYAMIGPPVARFADRGFRKPVVIGSLAIWSVATSLCGMAQNFWQFFLGRAAIGGAESASSPASLSMIADIIPREKLPRAYAIYTTGFVAGGAIAMTAGGLLLGALAGMEPLQIAGIGIIRDWQLVMILLGLPGILVAGLIALTVPEPQRRAGHKAKGYPLREVFGFLRDNRAMHGPMLAAALLNSMQSFGTVAWMTAFYERTYGWGPAKAGPILGPTNMIMSLFGLFAGAWLAERIGRKRDDANLRVMFLANTLCVPFLIVAPLMPGPWLALSLGALGNAIAAMAGAGYNSSLQVSTPNAMRGQINALYLFVIAAVGGTLGPLMIGMLTDFVAGREEYLRYVLVGFRLVLAPLDAYLLWIAIRPYGKAVRARVIAGD